MKGIKIFLVFVLLLLLFLSFSESKTKKIVDMAGREVEVPINVKRIVAGGPGALRLICYMKAWDKVVGIEQAEKNWGPSGRPYALAHPELLNLPPIGLGGPGNIGNGPDPELVTKLNPDVIFMTYMEKGRADDYQAKVKIPVVVLSYGVLAGFEMDEIFGSLRVIGKVLNNEKRAEEVIRFIRSCSNELNIKTRYISENKKPKVYVGGLGSRGSHGITSTSCKFPPFVAVNAKNVVDSLNKEGQLFIDKEQLLIWDPDYIFIDAGGYDLVMQDLKDPLFKSLKAIKNGNLYVILPFNFYTTNIDTALCDAYYIGKVLYPEKFKDLDPEKKADEIYEFLVGKPVYQEMKKSYGGFRRIQVTE